MNEKKSVKISLSTFFLIIAIIVIIIMGVIIYGFYNAKIEKTEEISKLNNQIETLQSTINQLQGKIDIIKEELNNNDEDKIVIEGTYSAGATGYVHEFHKDGTIREGDEFIDQVGTYTTIGNNQVKVVLTKRTTLVNMDTGEKTIEEINETYKVKVINEKALEVEGQDEEGKFYYEITKIEN